MKKTVAFVGHSFEEGDRELIRSFLDFFDALKKSDFNFDWDHAEDAKAIDTSQKVKEKMKHKTLFIGICTKKEQVIRHRPTKWIFPERLICKETDFEWKTSDWILQELGYSLGLGMNTILLLEDGIREIKGLHGTLEYINFDRLNPSLAFKKIVQQLSSIEGDKINQEQSEQSEQTAKSDEVKNTESTEDKPSILDYQKPKEDWGYDKYIWAMHTAIWNNNNTAIHEINKFYEEFIGNDNPELLLKWKGECLLIKQIWNNESAIGELNFLIKDNPDNKDLHFYLAQALEKFKQEEKAYEEYIKALVDGSSWNIQFLTMTIRCLADYKGNEAAKQFMESNIKNIIEKDRFLFIKVYSMLFKDDSPHIYCALLEAALNIKPDESSLRFDLAYKYSELKMKKLSIFHYKLLTSTSPSEASWNNLGIEYNNNSLPVKSINAFRNSEELDGTLAMSNISYRFINAGFEKEAREICDNALKIKDYDKRIPVTINSIEEKIEAENKAGETIYNEIKPDQDYLIKYAKSLVMPLLNDISGKCKSNECELEFSITDGKFEAHGSFEKEESIKGIGLVGLGFSANKKPQTKKITKHKITYQGSVRGCAGSIKILREKEINDYATFSSLLDPAKSNKEGMFYFDPSCNEFHVIELPTEYTHPLKPYTLKVLA